MPYIKEERRASLDHGLLEPEVPGELNYKISVLIRDYVNIKGLNYQTINDVMGALTSAQLEFYRRVAAPYEDKKIQENGDVY